MAETLKAEQRLSRAQNPPSAVRLCRVSKLDLMYETRHAVSVLCIATKFCESNINDRGHLYLYFRCVMREAQLGRSATRLPRPFYRGGDANHHVLTIAQQLICCCVLLIDVKRYTIQMFFVCRVCCGRYHIAAVRLIVIPPRVIKSFGKWEINVANDTRDLPSAHTIIFESRSTSSLNTSLGAL